MQYLLINLNCLFEDFSLQNMFLLKIIYIPLFPGYSTQEVVAEWRSLQPTAAASVSPSDQEQSLLVLETVFSTSACLRGTSENVFSTPPCLLESQIMYFLPQHVYLVSWIMNSLTQHVCLVNKIMYLGKLPKTSRGVPQSCGLRQQSPGPHRKFSLTPPLKGRLTP